MVKKPKRRKPRPKPEPDAKKESSSAASKEKKLAKLQRKTESWFPANQSISSPRDCNKIKGNLTQTKRGSRGA